MRKSLILFVAAFAAASQGIYAQSADDLLSQGREAFMDYRFNDAARLYAQAKAKAKRSDEFFADKYDTYHRQLNQAKSYLERVEAIEIIDSIAVDRNEFFRSYRLPASAGILGGREALPRELRDIASADYVFTSERGNYKIWAQPNDSTGYMTLMESNLLTDGDWSEPSPLSEELNEDADAIYPFMMADGVTLYYAENGENSIGGYDIMVATRDAADGSFMQPSNLGFPYNSPYDDYLLAIDELNGVGWWATDRNRLDDMITIYVFIPRELRQNYPADEENIVDFARISDYMLTQPDDADYDELKNRIAAIQPATAKREQDFTFRASGGRVFTNYDDLPSPNSRAAMRNYIAAQKDLDREEASLDELRRQYHKRATSDLGERIKRAEKAIESRRDETRRLRSEVYKTL